MSDTTVQIDDQVIDEVAKKATEQIEKSLSEKLEALKPASAEEIAKAQAELTEKTDKKNIHDDKTVVTDVKDGFESLSKEERFARGARAFMQKDFQTIQQYNAATAKLWKPLVSKSNYQNVTVAADGGALVPDPEFIAEIERLTDEYGVASRLATVRRTDRDSVTLLSGTNEVSFTRTSEATAVNAQKLTYAAATQALDKYICTLIMTSELVEDSAIDIFQDAATEIARARAKLFDQLVFTDSTYGLLYQPDAGEGWKTQTVGSAITDFTADDAFDAQYKVVSAARKGARYFMHPTVWNQLRKSKTGDGSNSSANYLFGGPGQMVTPNIDGVPVELVDVLPAVGDITANEPFALYGDLKRVLIHVKRLLETKVFDAGVVKDAGGTDFNLITQDSWAMRATLRAVPQTRFPGAFCVIGTGTVS